MKNLLILVILPVIFLNLLCFNIYSSETREKLGIQPAQIQQPPQVYQNQQPQRPMLQPAVSSPLLNTPPAPVVPPVVSTAPLTPPNFQPVNIQANFQNSPAKAILPAANAPAELPQIPVIGNSIGKVTDIGVEKDGLPWIEVKDELFNETLKIKINPGSTPVIKKNSVLSFKDIKTGDTVNVIFNQQDENIIANFISIMTEEDLKAMKQGIKSESNSENENKAKENPVSLQDR